MATPTVNWRGGIAAKIVQDATARGIRLAVAFASDEIKSRIKISNRVGGGGRDSRGRFTGGGAVSPTPGGGPPMRRKHSRPGEPPRSDTGTLRRSIFHSFSRSIMTGSVGTTVKYGVALEKGFKRGPIVPKRRRVLVFAGSGSQAGAWVFARRVRGVTVAPRPFIWDTVKRRQARIRDIIFQEVRRRTGGVGTGPTGPAISVGGL